MTSAPDPRYPIGKFQPPATYTDATRAAAIDDIALLPAKIRAAVKGFSEAQLDTPYRAGGWTARQVVHHLVDSHANAFIRFRLALTEENPAIVPYDQAAWANLADSRTMPVEPSLQILDGLHRRWVTMLKAMKPADFARTFRHPEQGLVTLDRNLALYAWHGKHHTAHVEGVGRMGA